MPLFTVLKNILVLLKTKKEFPNIIPKGDLSKIEVNNLKSNVKNLFGHQIAFTVINSADSIVISMILGLNDLAIYNNYYYIFSAVVSILTILFSSIQAGIGNDIIVNDNNEAFDKFLKFRTLIFFIVSFCSICLFTLYQPFMKIWMGNDMLLKDNEMFFFVIGFFITQTRRIVTTYKNAAGLWKEDFLKPYIIIVVDLLIDIILIKHVGLIGAMISTIISMFFIAFPWETGVLYKNLFKKNLIEYYIYYFKEIIILNICIVILRITLPFLPFSGIFGLLVTLIYSVLIFAIIYLLTHFREKNFIWIFKRTFKLLKNKQ